MNQLQSGVQNIDSKCAYNYKTSMHQACPANIYRYIIINNTDLCRIEHAGKHTKPGATNRGLRSPAVLKSASLVALKYKLHRTAIITHFRKL